MHKITTFYDHYDILTSKLSNFTEYDVSSFKNRNQVVFRNNEIDTD